MVDDNNPDTDGCEQTEQFMLRYAENKKVKYIKQEQNKGASSARNMGIKEANGKCKSRFND